MSWEQMLRHKSFFFSPATTKNNNSCKKKKNLKKVKYRERALTSCVLSGLCRRRSVGCNRRRWIEVYTIIRVCIHIIALNGQYKKKHGEEQEAQLTAPVATSSFRFSFAWRSHDLCWWWLRVALQFWLFTLCFLFFQFYWNCVSVSVASLFFFFLFRTRHKTTLYYSPLFYSLFYLLFETATSGRFLFKCVFVCLFFLQVW